jgi:hypothetical protein
MAGRSDNALPRQQNLVGSALKETAHVISENTAAEGV